MTNLEWMQNLAQNDPAQLAQRLWATCWDCPMREKCFYQKIKRNIPIRTYDNEICINCQKEWLNSERKEII